MKYKQEGDYLVGQPEMKEPLENDYITDTYGGWYHWQAYEADLEDYQKHLASLPRYKISGDKKVLEGRCDLIEDVDFELSTARVKPNYSVQTIVAIPIIPYRVHK